MSFTINSIFVPVLTKSCSQDVKVIKSNVGKLRQDLEGKANVF